MESDETSLKSSTTRQSTTPRRLSPKRPPSTFDEQKRRNRQSLRIRPSDLLQKQDAEAPLSLRSEPLPRESKMSLFNLFSRPKVERARGHVERSSPIQPPLLSKDANASRSDLAVPVEPKSLARAPSPQPPRPATAASKATSKLKFMDPAPPPRERRPGAFNPPPLFQAYPQSVKDGILEVSTISAETIHQKSKSRKAQGLQMSTLDALEDGTSETSQKTALRLAASGAGVELPRKIFVLVTSGYLLQYSETGPSDRLPEKMLHLGKDSAAFASDLVPGKYHVLQVSQAVDSEGVVFANSGSFLSKLGIRSAAAKRMMSSFLLVMPDSAEMGSWMTIIRREIENLGGKKISPDPVRPQTAKGVQEEKSELKKMPSQSHRYQVTRNPDKVENVSTPTRETFDIPPPPKLEPEHESNLEVDKADVDANTIDGIEMEASKLEEDSVEPAARQRAMSDAPSQHSSAAVSLEQQQLNNVRSSLSNSTRVSRNSQAGTFATTVGTSRTNSLTGSPPALDLLNEEVGPNIPVRSPKRALSALNLSRRRSAVPASKTKEMQSPSSLNTSPAKGRHSVIVESPVVGHSPPISPRKRLSAMRSEPNLHGGLSNREKHDSKMPTPPMPAADGERPESFVGDLPPPSAWASNRTASRRISILQQQQQRLSPPLPPPQPRTYQPPPAEYTSPRATDQDKSKRISFSMPLKVNPSSPGLAPLSSNNRRRSQLNDPDPAGDMPLVHTLSAKADNRISVSHVQYHKPISPNLDESQRSPARSPSNRMSLRPEQMRSNGFTSPEPPRRSSSATALASFAQAHAQAYGNQQANGIRTLKRPTSMQIRSDSAPFLGSVRDPSTSPGLGHDIRAAPIRAMRPSRSSSNVAALANQPSPLEAFKALKFDTPPTVAEEADTPSPLPTRAISPMPSRPGSRSSVRRSIKPKSSLPELDLGIPVVGLGPPAPPPSAPLPAPPSGSRPTSPMSIHGESAGIEAVAGLGIRVS